MDHSNLLRLLAAATGSAGVSNNKNPVNASSFPQREAAAKAGTAAAVATNNASSNSNMSQTLASSLTNTNGNEDDSPNNSMVTASEGDRAAAHLLGQQRQQQMASIANFLNTYMSTAARSSYQPANNNGPGNVVPASNRVGLLDAQTRQLLQNILDLDAQMKGLPTSSNNGTSLSSSSTAQPQLKHQNSNTGSTETSSGSSSAAAAAAPASGAMMSRETSSSSGNSSDQDYIQVPCRARGQPPEHNYMNAYFTLRRNEKHGKELICSFPPCRDSGIKFSYCAYCRVPVARRNFRIRHHHADAKPLAKSKSKSSKHKKNKSKRLDPSRQRSSSMAAIPNAAASSAPAMAQAGAVAAAAAALASGGGSSLNASSLLINSLAHTLKQNQSSAFSSSVVQPNNMGNRQHAVSNAPAAMEEISRLGDSSSYTSSSDGSAVKIPCRARGMPLDHTIETAYFSIPKNIQHGDELICSYPACQASGVKFCYCGFCRIPVAKRNFRIRHAHFQNHPDMVAGEIEGKTETKESKIRKTNAQDTPSSTDDSDLTTQSPDGDEREPARVDDEGNNNISSQSRTKKKRKKVWSKMLDHFPTEGDAASKKEWLAQVLLVSDKKTPRKELRTDIEPRNDTRELAAVYLEKSTKPRRRHRKREIKTAEV